jgi:excisionase family DNA binding protein
MAEANTGERKTSVLGAKWDGKDAFTGDEVRQILRVSKWTAYEAVKKGSIPVVRIGKRCIIPRASLERLLTA